MAPPTAPELPAGLQSGQPAVFKGLGVVWVEGCSEGDGEPVVEFRQPDTGMRCVVPCATASTVLRPLVERAEAERAWARLREVAEPDDRPWSERYLDGAKTLAEGSLQEQLERLRVLYASPFVPSPGEIKLMRTYEDAVLAELAAVLGRDRGQLEEELKALHPVFRAVEVRPPDPVPKPPEGPDLEGYRQVGRADFGDTVWISEAPPKLAAQSGDYMETKVRSGVWFGWVTEPVFPEDEADWDESEFSDDDFEEDPEDQVFLVAHETVAGTLPPAENFEALGHVTISTASVAVTDRAFVEHPRLTDEMRYLGGTGAVLDRALMAQTAINGMLPVAVHRKDGCIVALSIRF
ncbi:MAG TPA: hypothetical protein RMG48_20450 [Myxococcales bacterium LLY-WYZ-16_1]|nr:hypothetical protein [Myxococcales bacterium LLY-WYZ-16_1]